MNQGDIYLADVSAEVRRRVLVLSDQRFNHLTGRAIVAVEYEPEQVRSPPWHIAGFALEFSISVAADRLLDRVGGVSSGDLRSVRAALRQILP